MFWKKDNKEDEAKVGKLEEEIKELKKERGELKEKVEGLKLKKKIEEEDIKHMVTMKEERLALDHEKKVAETEKLKDAEIAKVKDEYRDKIEKNLEQQKNDVKAMYAEILQRLPDVNVKLKGNI